MNWAAGSLLQRKQPAIPHQPSAAGDSLASRTWPGAVASACHGSLSLLLLLLFWSWSWPQSLGSWEQSKPGGA